MSKSKTLRAVVASVALVASAALSAPIPASASGPVEITFWSRAAQADFIKSVGDAYNASQNKVRVKVTTIPDAQFVQKLSTAVATGAAPDVTSVDLILVPYFAKNGVFKDLTKYADGLKFKKLLSPAHMRLGKYKGKQFAMPFTAESSVLFWNKDLFKKAGLDPDKAPATWDDMLKAAKAVTALGNGVKGYYFSGNCGGCNIFTFTPFIWAAGGDILKSNGAPTFTDPVVADALQFYKNMWDNGYVDSGAQTDNGSSFAQPFATGKTGMVVAGAFYIGALKEHPEINYGVTPIPGKKAGQIGSFAGGDDIAVLSTTRHPKESQAFLNWVLTAGQKFIATKSVVPTRSDVAQKDYVAQDPRFKVIADMMSKGRTPWSTSYTPLIADAQSPWLSMIQKAVFGGDVSGAQKAAQTLALSIVKKG